MKQTMTWLAIAIAAISMLSGCGKQSRFDEATDVDVCAIVSQTDAERILGPLTRQPLAQPHAGGEAGDCRWSFKPPDAPTHPSMSPWHPMVRGAVPSAFDPLSKVGVADAEANIGHSSDIADLGDKALLFQSPQPDFSEVWMQQSKTYAILIINGGSSTQLVDFAKLLSKSVGTR